MNFIYLYYITQCVGISPFKYDSTSSRIYESTLFSFINLIVGCLVCFNTFIIQIVTALVWIPDRPKVVLLVVTYLEAIVECIQNTSLFCIQFRNRKKLVKLINEAFDLTSELKKICPQESLSSLSFRKRFRFKIICKSVQILLLIVTTFQSCLHGNNIEEWFFAAASFLMYFYPLFISTIYYYGSVLIAARFYEILNLKIENRLADINKNNQSKMQLFCDISDDVDCISVVYNRITSFVDSINLYLSLQIVILKFSSFITMLATVIFYNLNF